MCSLNFLSTNSLNFYLDRIFTHLPLFSPLFNSANQLLLLPSPIFVFNISILLLLFPLFKLT